MKEKVFRSCVCRETLIYSVNRIPVGKRKGDPTSSIRIEQANLIKDINTTAAATSELLFSAETFRNKLGWIAVLHIRRVTHRIREAVITRSEGLRKEAKG